MAATVQPSKKKRRWLRWTVLCVAILLLAAVATPFLFATALVRMIIAHTPYTRFSPTIASASLHPSGYLELESLDLRDPDANGNPMLVHADHVTVRFHWLQLLQPHLDSVEATGLVARVRHGNTLPVTLMGFAKSDAATPNKASQPSRFRCDFVHVDGALQSDPIAGIILPSQIWTLNGTFAMIGPDAAPMVSVDATLKPDAQLADQLLPPAVLDYHLKDSADAMTMSVSARGINALLKADWLKQLAPDMPALHRDMALQTQTFRAEMTMPHNGAASSWWADADIPFVGGSNADVPSTLNIKRLKASANGDLSSASVLLTAQEAAMAQESVESVALDATLRGGNLTIHSAGANVAGGRVDARGSYDFAASSASDVSIHCSNVQVSQAIAPFFAGKPEMDAQLNATLHVGSAAPWTRAQGWKSGIRLSNAAVSGQFATSLLEGIGGTAQIWDFAGEGGTAGDGASPTVNAHLLLTPAGTAASAATHTAAVAATMPAAGGSKIDISLKQDATALQLTLSANALSATIADSLIHRMVPGLQKPPSQVMFSVGSLMASMTIPAGRLGTTFYFELGDISAQTPVSAATPIQVMHVNVGGDGVIPVDARGWQDAFFAVRHFALENALLGKQKISKIELAAMLQNHTAYLQWINADYAQGRVTGYGQYDVQKKELTEVGLQLSDIQMHDVLAKLAPEKIDAVGLFNGTVTLKGKALEGTVELTTDGPGVLHVNDVPGLQDNIATDLGNKFAEAAMAELRAYHYVTGKVLLTSAGQSTVIKPTFSRDMTAPAVTIPGGIDQAGHNMPAQTRVQTIDRIVVSINSSLASLIVQASNVPAEFTRIFTPQPLQGGNP